MAKLKSAIRLSAASSSKKIKHSPFDAPIVLVQTINDSLIRALRLPTLEYISNNPFVSGFIVSADPSHFDQNKRIFINLKHIVAITEFASEAEILGSEKHSQLTLVKAKK